MGLSITMTDEEQLIADSYARLHEISLAEAFKNAFFEKIENEFDLSIAQKAYEEYLRDDKKSRPIEKLFAEVGI